jgi:hypothetical protein
MKVFMPNFNTKAAYSYELQYLSKHPQRTMGVSPWVNARKYEHYFL